MFFTPGQVSPRGYLVVVVAIVLAQMEECQADWGRVSNQGQELGKNSDSLP